MNLPRPKSTEVQLKLFEDDQRIKSMGHLRWAVGDYYEQLTRQVSGAARLMTDSNADICPDHHFLARTYFECKAVGKTGRTIFYTGRIARYDQFFNLGNAIDHWIWCHNVRVGHIRSFNALHSLLLENTRQLLIIDFPLLKEIISKHPQTPINSQYNIRVRKGGYHNNEEYGSGWSIPIKTLREHCFKIPALIVGNRTIDVYSSSQEFEQYYGPQKTQ